jgi:hypothetical protein
MSAHPLDHGIRVGTVADQIAAAEGAVVVTGSVAVDGFEGFPIGVEIAQDQIAHDERLCLSQPQ